VIVRISNEGQYELPESEVEALNALDDQTVVACEADEAERFHDAFTQMLEFVRSHGQPVAEDTLEGSDVILPPSDTTLAEATREFTGEGLIPD